MTRRDIILSREGVFPLANGNTGLHVSGTIQGEGKLAGMPSMFVRLQGCNLRCIWSGNNGHPCCCDTAHTSFGPGNAIRSSVADIISLLKANMGSIRHVVITGGEPLLQPDAISELLSECHKNNWHTTVETNGTIFNPDVCRLTSLLSISPKLLASIPTKAKTQALGIEHSETMVHHESLIRNIEPLQQLVASAHEYNNEVQLKFVVSNPDDESEIKSRFADILSMLNPCDVVIMPMGYTTQEIAESNKAALEMVVRNGWRYTPRLHIDLFGNKEGV